MAYGLKYYFVDKKIVGTTTTTYQFEILEDGYSGSSTEWTGVDIKRNYDQLSYRKINYIQKSSCTGVIIVEDATQRSEIETIAGSEQGEYKVQLKKNGAIIWTGLVVPELISLGEENYRNQTAQIVAKDIFLTGDYPLATVASGVTEKAIVIIADILDTLGFGLNIVTYTSWIDDTLTQSDDILNQAYHEKERFRQYSNNATEEPRAISNEQALNYMLGSYGLILRQVGGNWNLIQITAYENLSAVSSYAYTSAGVQYFGSRSNSVTGTATSNSLYVLGNTSNNFFAGVKKVTSKFQHESTIQGIKFRREYWIDDGATLEEEQFWQADGTGNLELSFLLWYAKTTSGDLGNTNVLDVRIFVETGGASDFYWDGDAWTNTVSTIQVNVEETHSTTDSDGNYVHKGQPFSIVTDPIPDAADGTLKVAFIPDSAQPNYAYWYLRDVNFNLTYSDDIDGTSFAIDFELEQSGTFSDVYDYGTYFFGEGPTSASLSAIKDSTGDLLASWKRYGDASTVPHQELILNEILNVRRTPKRNMRATLYGEYSPANILVYDSTNFFFLGGSWSSKNYNWSCNFTDVNYSEASDTLSTFYLTDGQGTSDGAVGSTGSSGTTSPTNALLKANNLSDVNSASTSRDNLDLGTSDTVEFNELGIGASSITSGFKVEISGGFLRVGDTQGEDGVESGWFAGGNRGFVQVYDRADAAFRDLLINNSLTIESGGDATLAGDLEGQSATFGDGTTNEEVRVYYSDGKYIDMQGFGFDYDRTISYHRPNTDVAQELVIGTDSRQWNSIKFDSTEYRFRDDGTLVFFIDNTGDVGIGNPTHNARLHVKKATADLLRLERADGTGTTDIDLVFSGGIFGADDADEQYAKITCARSDTLSGAEKASLEFYIKKTGTDTLGMTLDNDGCLLVNTTDSTPNGVSNKSHIVSINDGNGIFAGHFATNTTSGATAVVFSNTNGLVGYISTSGTSTTYSTSSDYRLKENVVEMTGALERVMQLKPSRFNFIADGDTILDGFLAHEVADIVPEAITGEKDAVDEEGNPIYQGIDQSKLVPLLVGAIKELKAEIEELKAQLS